MDYPAAPDPNLELIDLAKSYNIDHDVLAKAIAEEYNKTPEEFFGWEEEEDLSSKKESMNKRSYRHLTNSLWKMKINLSGIWNSIDQDRIKDDEDYFVESRDRICRRLDNYEKWIRKRFGSEVAEEYEDLVDQLRYSADVEEFNSYWDDLYDFADHYRIWIEVRFS